MGEMKYVVVHCDEAGEQLFIFPKNIDHDEFASVLSYIKTGGYNWTRPVRMPVSAGFTDGESCYGRSETLGLEFRAVDSELLAKGG